jgi:glycerol-3-phosphate dehydrogenase (NAD(P)+)
MNITVLGEGAWGTAVAQLLACNGHRVTLWCYHIDSAQEIAHNRTNTQFAPTRMIHANINPVTSIEEAVADANIVFEAIPVKFLRATLELAKPYAQMGQIWVTLSKGIEIDSLLLPTQMIDDVFTTQVEHVVVSGPSFAYDVFEQQPTGVTVASITEKAGGLVSMLLQNTHFTTHCWHDVMGAQVSGAVKNVIALGVGILDGAGYTDNTKALLVTQSLKEVQIVITYFGGASETMYELCGIGDVMLTALGSRSRNLLVGKQLGSGTLLSAILQETGHIPEGITTVQSVYELAKQYNLKLPLCVAIYRIIFEKEPISILINQLITEIP